LLFAWILRILALVRYSGGKPLPQIRNPLHQPTTHASDVIEDRYTTDIPSFR
jgi:hypothetical protein